jgi:hypothetical protein
VQVFEAGALATILLEAVTITGIHEAVQSVLEQVDRLLTPLGQVAEAAALSARIYILIGQALLMRHDVGFDRRVMTYRDLLAALFKSPEVSPATAFAALVIAGAESAIARSLRADIDEHLASDSAQRNLDFALAVAIVARTSERGRQHAQVGAFLSLVSGINEYLPRILRDIFVMVGFRDGDAHETALHRLLGVPLEGAAGGTVQTVLSLVESLIERLERLKSNDAWMPRAVDHDRINRWIARLGTIYGSLRHGLAGHGRHAGMAVTWRELSLALYGGALGEASIYRELQEAFSINVGQIGPFVKATLERKQRDAGNALWQKLERKGDQNFAIDKVEEIRALHLLQIEDCIYELIDNAAHYSTESFPGTAARVRWSAAVGDGDAIIIEIWNRCAKGAGNAHASMSQKILEDLGGRVEAVVREVPGGSEFVSRVRLPTLLDLATVH